ncbi:MAG: glycoside hydrolase, partial [Bacteroidetes bacterium]|nr:glycoside hydrolase [Bacteroidota bacterium]
MKNFLHSIILTLFCVALFLFPHLLSAQWGRTDGPEEVNGTCLLYHNQRLWGGTWGGLYYSDDLAEHWHFVPAVKAPESVTSMVEWHDSLFVLAETPRATDDSIEVKLYFSPDNGLNWFKQANLPYIISDAYEPVQLFKSADRLILRSSYKTLMASDDGGISWHFIFILGNVYQYDIREDVILGLGKEGLFRSINGGRTWDKV